MIIMLNMAETGAEMQEMADVHGNNLSDYYHANVYIEGRNQRNKVRCCRSFDSLAIRIPLARPFGFSIQSAQSVLHPQN